MFLTPRFYITTAALVLVIASGYFLPPLYYVGLTLSCLVVLLTVAEGVLLYYKKGVAAERHLNERFSNGDDNTVVISIQNHYPFRLRLSVIDEIPFIFQRRDIDFRTQVSPRGTGSITYRLRPTKRGSYAFGRIRVFASTVLGLLERRFTCGQPFSVKVYPSYLALRNYEFLAMNNRLSELGIKKVRRAGNNTEFEQIRDYVVGDDYRRVNWKASARRSRPMVNVYQTERSQQIVCLIDGGRIMQQSFRQMTLLDYSINASLVLSYVAISKDDKAGIATFSNSFETFIAPAKHHGQMQTIQESLYRQRPTFGETDYSALVDSLNRHLNKRSLLILFTNFSGRQSLMRQLPYLVQLSRRHRLLVVFFEDNELREYIATPYTTTEDYYRHVIAEKTASEQRLVVSLLRRKGITSLLTTPGNLSVDVINKYLELRNERL